MRKLAVANTQGQALIELILAISLASFFLTTFVVGIISVREAFNHSSVSSEAKSLLQREVEALRSIKETSWNSFTTGETYHVVQSGNTWTAVSGTVIDNKLTHGFTVADVCRLQATFALDDCLNPLSTPDPATRKITTTVSWSFLGTQSISSSLYLTRHAGNTVWTQTTQAQFNLGAKTNTQVVNNSGGEVELTQSSATADYGNKFLVTATSALGAMSRTSGKTSLRFTAQGTKAVSAVRVYVNTKSGTAPTYRFGIQTNNPTGNLPSGTWIGGQGTLANPATGWRTASLSPAASLTAGQIYHLVVESTGTGTATGSISLRRSAPLNLLYPQTQVTDPMSNTLFTTTATFSSGSIQNFQPIYELDFNDAPQTFEGNPFESNNNGTEIIVTGNNWFGERFSFAGADKTTQSVSFYIRRNGTPPNNLNVQIRRFSDNSLVYTGTLATPSLPKTYAFVTHTFSPSPLTLTAGTVYRVIIQTSGGSNNNSYRFYRLNTTNAANFNSITYDGTNSVYTNSPSAGVTGSWVDTNNFDMSGFFFTVASSGGYATSGTFESQTFDCTVPTVPATIFCNGGKAGYNYITMTVNEPPATNVRLQIAVNDNNSTWNYVGPDGSAATYFDNTGAIPLQQAKGRYFRFKATLDGNGAVTPILYDATVNYSP